jgi:hypothetical protein
VEVVLSGVVSVCINVTKIFTDDPGIEMSKQGSGFGTRAAHVLL